MAGGCCDETSGYLKGGEFLVEMRHYQRCNKKHVVVKMWRETITFLSHKILHCLRAIPNFIIFRVENLGMEHEDRRMDRWRNKHTWFPLLCFHVVALNTKNTLKLRFLLQNFQLMIMCDVQLVKQCEIPRIPESVASIVSAVREDFPVSCRGGIRYWNPYCFLRIHTVARISVPW
jgi:hypothetical protein